MNHSSLKVIKVRFNINNKSNEIVFQANAIHGIGFEKKYPNDENTLFVYVDFFIVRYYLEEFVTSEIKEKLINVYYNFLYYSELTFFDLNAEIDKIRYKKLKEEKND